MVQQASQVQVVVVLPAALAIDLSVLVWERCVGNVMCSRWCIAKFDLRGFDSSVDTVI